MPARKKASGSRPRKMKAYASFAEWKRDQSARNQRLIGSLQRIVKAVAPDWEPSVKWGQGCWLMDGKPKAYIHAEDDHVQFGFYEGASLKDPDGLLVGYGKYVRHVKVHKSTDVPREALERFLEQLT
jgi:hypothetical protein